MTTDSVFDRLTATQVLPQLRVALQEIWDEVELDEEDELTLAALAQDPATHTFVQWLRKAKETRIYLECWELDEDRIPSKEEWVAFYNTYNYSTEIPKSW